MKRVPVDGSRQPCTALWQVSGPSVTVITFTFITNAKGSGCVSVRPSGGGGGQKKVGGSGHGNVSR